MSAQSGFAVADILPALNGRLVHGNPQTRFTNFCIDSRYVDEDTLFVPLMGQSRDGHHFIIDSISKGAVATLIRAGHHQLHEILSWLNERAARYGQRELERVCVIEVRHTLVGLQKLAEWFRLQHEAKVIGITGSVGKTGIKEMLIQMLSEKLVAVGTEKNFNNEIGVPLALSKLSSDSDVAVVEMAMRARGEISLLSRIAHPEMVMISNTSGSHVGRLGSFDEIYKAKSEIIDGLKPGGTVLLNRRDPNVPQILQELSQRRSGQQDYQVRYFDASSVFRNTGLPPFVPPTCGANAGWTVPDADVWIEDYEPLGLEGSKLTLRSKEERVGCHIPLLGRGIVENFAAAALAAVESGMSLNEVARIGSQLLPSPQRLHLMQLRPGLFLIDDCYNSSPASARDSIELLATLDPKLRKIVILGDMLELGKYETLLHRQVALTALSMPLDTFVAVGPRMNAVNEVEARDDIELYYVEGNSELEHNSEAVFGARRNGRGWQGTAPPPPPPDSVILDDAAAAKISHLVMGRLSADKRPAVVLIKGSRALHLERIVNDLIAGTAN
jgi:UDP-N-acetylmuramoyl-tripeptide--D-alanyl-D-alanine ligase